MIDIIGLVMISAANNYPDKQGRLNDFWEIWKGHSPHSAAGRAAVRKSFPGRKLDSLLALFTELTEN